MAAGPSFDGRLGKAGKDVAPTDAVWDYIAYYIGQALEAYTVILRPERIVLGGGVMKVPGMLDNIKAKFTTLLADYVPVPAVDDYLVTPGLIDDAGITGALILANEMKG
jgi:fructokinase